ncbi:MAG: sugar porter family MFS transporter [Reyranella sp.]|uniref:sugar porter family MFS transporter n=1 Tax=Reyranella sp. TaxID=1929291 RepID=UPI0009634586|nr:sugar porter family MFS transporter [Reyranella sp.]MBN9539458.1 sugar porter family MFS transporter [Alphaproteobacteria bacterium]MBR2814339.1 sugar porter family MFS transporter [Reyranella sp.]OJU46812.1 MAG: MFS transporter [Alphaproteobacteria bacterium 65-37]
MIYFLAFVAAIAGFLFGYDEGVIAVARASLDKDFPMGPLVGGFMTAAVPLGALVAASVAGRITDRFGRRSVLMAAAALFMVGALVAASISAVWMLIVARFVLGLAIGMAAVAAPLYIAECAPLAIRGALVSTYQLAITVGILMSYLTGLMIAGDGTWRVMFGLGVVPGALFLVGLAFLPESPRWLVLKGFTDKARAGLGRLRGPGWDVDRELTEMVRTAKEEAGQRVGYSALLEPSIRPALIVGVGLFFLQQLSGINAVIYYAPEIFNHAGFDSANTQMLATVGIGTVNVLTTIVAMFLIDRVGRRPLLVIGFLGTAFTMLVIALGVVFPGAVPSWIIIAMLLLYIASFAIAVGPLPHLLMSEIFPLRVRGPGMSMASLSNWGFNFLVVFAFPLMLAGPGLAFTFTVFAVICLGGIAFTLTRVPETTGHSLEAIERHLMSGQALGAMRRNEAVAAPRTA